MAKKKKKEKKKKEKAPEKQTSNEIVEETPLPSEALPQINLNSALSAHKSEVSNLDTAIEESKETHNDLQGLLSNIASGDGFFRREVKEEEKIQPQLVYESSETQAMKDFLMEGVPLTERKIGKSELKKRTRLIDSSAPKKAKPEETEAKPIKIGIPEISLPPPIEEIPEEEVPTEEGPGVKEAPSIIQEKKESVYPKLEVFFTNLIEGYSDRYNNWEESISNILSILRQMRKVTKKNTEDLVLAITNSYSKVQTGLDEFVSKRNEVEKIAEIDIETLSVQFKKVLGMLELQVKEYQLKRVADEYIHSF